LIDRLAASRISRVPRWRPHFEHHHDTPPFPSDRHQLPAIAPEPGTAAEQDDIRGCNGYCNPEIDKLIEQ
jgi:hypothetical protein